VCRAILVNPNDNVATVVADVDAGEEVAIYGGPTVLRIKAEDTVGFGHKLALADIPEGGDIIKYGEVIGRATRPIRKGEIVHLHNTAGTRVPARGTR